MIIYTVIGTYSGHYKGIGKIITSFSGKKEADMFISKCEEYEQIPVINNYGLSSDEMSKWEDNHPAGDAFLDSYDVIEHELVDVLDSIKTHMDSLGSALNRVDAMHAENELYWQKLMGGDE